MREKIKIIHILPSLDRGGAEKITVDLLLSLDPERFAPQLILFKWGGFWEGKLAGKNIPVTILKKHGRFDPLNFWHLLQTLKKIKPQIVHTHLGGDIYGRLAARILNIPVIISTEHNVNYHEPAYLSWLKRWTGRWATKIVAVSEAVQQDALKRYQLPADRVMVIYNGLDFSEFTTNRAAGQPQPLIMGHIGRLSPQKGQLSLIKAAALAKSRNWVIKIAGAGELRPELEKEIKSAGLEDRVQLVGLVDHPAEFLKSLDVFIFPSLWEGLGIAVLEAAASGLPIIASRVDGLKEILNEDNSFLFPAGDIPALAEKIDWFSQHFSDSVVQQKARAAQEKVRQNFSLEKSSRAYTGLYEELIKKHEDSSSQ